MDIGIFGGSFDPIHLGHLIVAQSAAEQLGLDVVRFIPTHTQPFKQADGEASPGDRLSMVELALEGHASFVADAREIQRGGVSYTIDTVASLHDGFPDDRLFLMVGADAAAQLSEWRDSGRIRDLACVVALSRAGRSVPHAARSGRDIVVPAIGISATAIRERVKHGKSIRYLVPDPVGDYIAKHGLYTEG